MATYIVEYVYDLRSELLDEHRPAHRAYLGTLVDAGTLLALGRYDDDAAPGALLVFEADSPEAVDNLVHMDPFVLTGLVTSRRTRRWAVTWGSIPR